jgi:hypothetical protein
MTRAMTHPMTNMTRLLPVRQRLEALEEVVELLGGQVKAQLLQARAERIPATH